MISKKQMLDALKSDPEKLVQIANNDPALLDYLLADAEQKQKWVRLMPEYETQLKQAAKATGLAEGILIGAGITLLLLLLLKKE